MKAKVASIAAHGINVFVNRQLVYNYPESLFAEAGIMCIEHADFEGVERRVCFSRSRLPKSTDPDSLSC
jgi:T-complex protein 1 subunit beta